MPYEQHVMETLHPEHMHTTAATKDSPQSSVTLESKGGSTAPFNLSEPIVFIKDGLARMVHCQQERIENGESRDVSEQHDA